MSGQESLRGFGFQTHVMLLCFLEHCAQGIDFYMIGEPATNITTGDFVDIKIFATVNGGPSQKIIQVKKSIDSDKAKKVVNTLLEHHLQNDDQIELWFTDYVLQNKMALLDAYDKLIDGITTPEFAEREIKKTLGNKEIVISVDGGIASEYSFDGTTLKLKDFEALEGTSKSDIEDLIVRTCGLKKQSVISNIKMFLNDTLIYRRHKFLDELSVGAVVREEIVKKHYDYFKRIVIRRIGEEELLLKIKALIPHPFDVDEKELCQDILFSFFFDKSSRGQKIEMGEVNALIKSVANKFGHSVSIIDWGAKSVHGACTPRFVLPNGNFTMGGQQQ